MDRLHSLNYGLDELRRVIGTLDDSVMDAPTNCEPWSVRRLASHALNNQLVWAGLVTGQQLVPVEVALGAEPIDGDLEPVAADITTRAMALWRTHGILDAVHATPFGELPGSAVIDFAIIDAVAHAWDLSTSVGRPLEFEPGRDRRTLRGRRGDLHRRCARARLDQAPYRAPGRCDRHRTADVRRGPSHPSMIHSLPTACRMMAGCSRPRSPCSVIK